MTEPIPADAPEAPGASEALGMPDRANAREMPDVQSWHLPRLIIAWAVAAVIGVLVTILVPDEQRFEWLSLAIGLATLVTFALQLGTAQKVGFITRTAASVAGAVLVIAVIDVFGWLLAL